MASKANQTPYIDANGKVQWTTNQNLVMKNPSNYTYAPDGNGGVNYFLNGKPITNKQYSAGTGQSYASIQENVRNSFNAGNASQSQGVVADTSSNVSGSSAYDNAVAAAKAKDDALRSDLKGRGKGLIDQLLAQYSELRDKVKKTGADTVARLNGEYDGKVKDQIDDTNRGLYTVDQVSAANNLGDSSYRSFYKGDVQAQGDKNVKTVNAQRSNDIATIGSQVNRDLAEYDAAGQSLGDTGALLDTSDNTSDVSNTVNTLSGTLAKTRGASAKYDTQGSFVQAANKLGNYDTSQLSSALDAVVGNSSATRATKTASVNQLIDGTGADDATKTALKNKYIQQLG